MSGTIDKPLLVSSYLSKFVTERELLDDSLRVTRLCSLLSKDEIDTKSAFNQLIILLNVMDVPGTFSLLETKMGINDEEKLERLYSFCNACGILEYKLPSNEELEQLFLDTMKEVPHYAKIFKSFRRW
jgi:hypothetical protein